ncbi:hypothetical protein B7463_g12592, partial [Scytalidium lignicola]
MRDVYKGANKVLVLDQLLVNHERDISAIQAYLLILTSRWMRRLWTFHEAVLARDILIQFKDGAASLANLYYTMHNSRSPSLLCSWYDNDCIETMKPFVEGLDMEQSFNVAIYRVVAVRSSSRQSDETICLANVQGIELKTILDIDEEDYDARMKEYFHLVRKLPVVLHFQRLPRLAIKGFNWAPTSLLTRFRQAPTSLVYTDHTDMVVLRAASSCTTPGENRQGDASFTAGYVALVGLRPVPSTMFDAQFKKSSFFTLWHGAYLSESTNWFYLIVLFHSLPFAKMDRHDPPAPDDFELSDIENEAFLPNEHTSTGIVRRKRFLTSWMPYRVQNFIENLSRMKAMIILLCTFAMLAFLGFINSRPKSISIPAKSLALSAELAKSLAGTAIPEYALAYAPIVVLEKTDKFYPSDLAIHIANTHPALNFTPVTLANPEESFTLYNLDQLNDLGGEEIYLTSNSKLSKLPKYLHGKEPNSKTLQTENTISSVIIVTDKGNGIVDVFYMYFYTFNQGPTVYLHELGDHLGDWEHNMIRFKDGVPTAVWYSQHEYGQAFTYDAAPKVGKRPLCFSARGSHANYAVIGKHDLHDGNDLIPENIVFDHTSQGHLWDPTLSAYYYTYSVDTKKFTPSGDDTPVNYLYFNGKWGDQEYLDDSTEQSSFQGFHKWTDGPQGPWFKHLDREDVCLPHEVPCVILPSL